MKFKLCGRGMGRKKEWKKERMRRNKRMTSWQEFAQHCGLWVSEKIFFFNEIPIFGVKPPLTRFQ